MYMVATVKITFHSMRCWSPAYACSVAPADISWNITNIMAKLYITLVAVCP